MKVVVLAGGRGTRLGLNGIPKPMVPLLGKPLLERIVQNLASSGFRDFVFLNGYLASSIEKHFFDGSQFGVSIQHLTEQQPLGTAGAFRGLRDRLTEPFIVVYGDILFDVDFRSFAAFAREKGGLGTLLVHPNDHPHDSDLVKLDHTQRITKFHSKPHEPGSRLGNLVSAALYVLSPDILNHLPASGPCDWGKDVFPRLAAEGNLFGYRSCEYAKDVGTPDRIKLAESHLRSGRPARLNRAHRKPALFLDRDGVINTEVNGAMRAGDVSLIAGSSEAIRQANSLGVPVICVTNQPGIAKGLMTWDDLANVHAELDCLLADEAGAYIDDYFICPHHPESGWPGEVPSLKVVCECRKPKAGLILEAAECHGIDLSRSWLVGDRYCDIAAANSAGVRSVLVETGHAGNDRALFPNTIPEAMSENLLSAWSKMRDLMSC